MILREEYVKSLEGSTEYLAKQVFKYADAIGNVPIEQFNKQQFIELLYAGSWVTKDALYNVKRLLRSYAAFLNERGIAFDLQGLDSISSRELNKKPRTRKYYASFEEMETEFRTGHEENGTEWRDKSILLLRAVGLSNKEVAGLRFRDIGQDTITTPEGVYHEVEDFVINHLQSRRGQPDELMFNATSRRNKIFTETTAQNIVYKASTTLKVSERSMLPSDLAESYLLLKFKRYEEEHKPDKLSKIMAEMIEYWSVHPLTPHGLKSFRITYRDWKANL